MASSQRTTLKAVLRAAPLRPANLGTARR
jgi:hypothetical protein